MFILSYSNIYLQYRSIQVRISGKHRINSEEVTVLESLNNTMKRPASAIHNSCPHMSLIRNSNMYVQYRLPMLVVSTKTETPLKNSGDRRLHFIDFIANICIACMLLWTSVRNRYIVHCLNNSWVKNSLPILNVHLDVDIDRW
jgi:hypothetical protein